MTPRGTVHVPGDKSISHRALMLSALADGSSTVKRVLRSTDVDSTASVLSTMGARIEMLGTDAVVHGRGIRGLEQPSSDLECGNSGTTTRLVAGIVAGHPFQATFIGDASLSARPMRRVAQPLEQMGAHFDFARGDGLPMTVTGASLQSIGYATRTASAQIKSAILLAALVAQVPVTVTEPAPSRDHTERMMAARGVDVMRDGSTISLGVARSLAPLDVNVPGDPSSAAFFIALAAASEGGAIDLPDVCLNPTRTGFIQTVRRMGAVIQEEDLRVEGGETIGLVRATGSGTLMGVTVAGDQIPSMIDELPMLACLAARAIGQTIVSGAEELRFKESDRIGSVVANLRAIGVDASERPDGLRVIGSAVPLKGRVDPHGDHRLAMAFGVLGALPGNNIEIVGADCVAVSYPNFWTDLARVTT